LLARGTARFDLLRTLPQSLAPCLVALLLLVAGRAYADASVLVEVKRADGSSAEGTVRLIKGETKLSCVTSKGRCEIKNVPGGSYTVELEQSGKPAGKPKTVMIPPAGEVKLIVAAN
jgi:hypothetical protein